ncbi:DNA gyrase subunit A [Candidatus Peribacteria bacterium RIFCSPLOWO2_12_FULL_55_15]|nr:MAG: DNA gyrase subunit A [Candidatus Peribacteria bacterium RIFCSPHIGHO2_01_FULL_54_22]OGJ62635.1 MAG: DNA gyrase subunit A [Candidatus Peribacteria bacterium RIFCSPHIGHO2_02_FULL_55_24]OGJ67953.1 MAG: DNA gyrase subunit A [Candidatus Peribacteria bacterium RIFCSPLOWO2_01_FULL_54_110]OGJ70278.1 MAG: DNA gyrase subunit A [Candidatus Peribacteria bacterium RIFCSPLOWO2_02_FULL_55_36]OGJ72267.1 MAG: DNA gyrase subunit A [Candidatus Peribacteria bacterium RIFCSPLOWO2_12_FULL_55_15]
MSKNDTAPVPDEKPEASLQPPLSAPGETLSTLGRIKPRAIVAEMEESYLDYAMSVIVSRALPDARDGLKPVHRRILYAMHEMGLRPTARFRKCAAVVGEVLGKYHPHGDAPVYEALVRMAQVFSMRYLLVDGQGNFGSVDGDSPAAMRYTEARMTKMAEELLQDIEKETVDFRPNYDASRREPVVLPSKIPNLLLNGTVGIAVGMATNIPPHNLLELLDATEHVLAHPEASVEDLLQFVKGPDFPTGGIVYDKKAIAQAYLTGRGSVVIRGKAEIEEMDSGRFHIRISEIPYQVNKSALVERMAQLVQDKVIQGISDIRDESDRDGIRVIVELKRDAYPQKVLNQLFHSTDLQTSFGYNCIALKDGIQPHLMNLAEFLQVFIGHRRTVVTRRVTFDRDRAKERAHILEGLTTALDHIDEVVALIKKSETKDVAKERLMKTFKLSELQAAAILDMRLQTLAGLERKKVEDELKEKKKFIAECEAILVDPKKIDAVISKEFAALREAYGDVRRTKVVVAPAGEFSAKDTIPNAPMIVTLTRSGYVKRLSPLQFRAQHRGGKGVKGVDMREDDEVLSLLHVMNHDDLLFFTNTGRVFQLPVYELPQAGRVARGQAIVNILQLKPGERVTAILRADLKDAKYLFMVTHKGTVKRTDVQEFHNIRRSGLIAQKLPEGDDLQWVATTNSASEILLLTRQGKAIRFKEDDVRSMGRAAAGVRGIKLTGGDHVVEAAAVRDAKKSKLLVVMENGLGKMSSVEEYRFQWRGGTGVKAAQLTTKTGNIVGGCVLEEGADGDLLCLSKQGQAIRMRLSDIPLQGRATQGVIVMRLDGGDKVASMSVVLRDEEAEKAVEEAAREEWEEEVEGITEEKPVRARKAAAKV